MVITLAIIGFLLVVTMYSIYTYHKQELVKLELKKQNSETEALKDSISELRNLVQSQALLIDDLRSQANVESSSIKNRIEQESSSTR